MEPEDDLPPSRALDWELLPFDFSHFFVYDEDWGIVEIFRFPGTQKVPALLKPKPVDVTLTGCKSHCLYPSDFRCRNLPCFNKLMTRSDLD
jgi:hypothetical protein